MTDRVDLDSLDVGDGEADDNDGPRRGDWFWHGEGDPANESVEEPTDGIDGGDGGDGDPDSDRIGPDASDPSDLNDGEASARPEGVSGDSSASASEPGASASSPVPHVPRENESKPVGIPVGGGGAGGTSARAAAEAGGSDEGSSPEAASEPDGEEASTNEGATAGTGSSGAGTAVSATTTSAMTMAFSYGAVKRLASPVLVMANAGEWTDWIGVVGNVDAYVINKFVREEGLDIDFFNGAGTSPTERLAEISTNPNSMFAAERTVLVGVDADRPIADRTDWEFVPLEEAADAAGWELTS
jgi:hypothetical protein